ncbi:Myb-like DNA-binding domain protein [Mortierella sp. AD094]|nr:Myb-like DNA-binding domain protein [Mortierella sp. AD094]
MALAEALRINQSLTWLDMDENDVTMDGFNAILSAFHQGGTEQVPTSSRYYNTTLAYFVTPVKDADKQTQMLKELMVDSYKTEQETRFLLINSTGKDAREWKERLAQIIRQRNQNSEAIARLDRAIQGIVAVVDRNKAAMDAVIRDRERRRERERDRELLQQRREGLIRAPRNQTDDPWTRQEDELLFDLRQQGMAWKNISATIKRPVGSCYSRYYRFLDPFLADAIEDDPEEEELTRDAVDATRRILEANVPQATLERSKEKSGLPLPYSVQGPWTIKDRERLEALVNSKTPWPVIARDLQRNQYSCKEKWHRIRKDRREKKQYSKRVRGQQWNKLFKEGFTPHHRDQLVRAVEKQLSAKRSQTARKNDPLGIFDMEDRRTDGGAFAMMMLDQTHDFADAGTTGDDEGRSYSEKLSAETIDWDAIALDLNSRFPAPRLKSIYRELATTKLIWTPEEDDRLIRAVIRLGPPEFQPRLWTMIKDAFGDVIRTSDDYRDRWRVLDMPAQEREWDDSEKIKFWRRWMEFQSDNSLFSDPSFSGTKKTLDTEKGSIESESQNPTTLTSSHIDNENMWDIIAEGLEYRHGRDCQLYFERMTAHFPKDPELFRYLSKQVADVYVKPRKAYWSSEATRMLAATVNSFQQANKVISWNDVAKSLGYRFTAVQCMRRWFYWSQKHRQGQPAHEDLEQENIVGVESSNSERSPKDVGDDSDVNTSENRLWADHELGLLDKGVQDHGHNWAPIRDGVLPHRTTQMIHERYWRSQAKKTGRFSEQERSLLEMAIETFGEDADWATIASQVPGRTANQCRRSWIYSRTHHVPKLGEPWTDHDRERLKKAVGKFGTKKWSLISEFVVGKTPDQCRIEWKEKLDPIIKKGPWSSKELDLLMERVETIMSRKEEKEKKKIAEAMEKIKKGTATGDINIEELAPRFKGRRRVDWKEVAKGMDGRTPEQCRERFRFHRDLYHIQGDF